VISLALIVTQPVPFFDQFLEGIENLNYPKEKLHLLIFSNVPFHDDDSKSFVSKHGEKYATAKYALSTDELDERQGRQLAL